MTINLTGTAKDDDPLALTGEALEVLGPPR